LRGGQDRDGTLLCDGGAQQAHGGLSRRLSREPPQMSVERHRRALHAPRKRSRKLSSVLQVMNRCSTRHGRTAARVNEQKREEALLCALNKPLRPASHCGPLCVPSATATALYCVVVLRPVRRPSAACCCSYFTIASAVASPPHLPIPAHLGAIVIFPQ
jgi:hypothetical protein